MKYLLLPLLTFFLTTSFKPAKENVCLKPEEQKLYDLLMQYRNSKNLPEIPLSYSLCKVAKLHVYDLAYNNPTNSKCNLHSWSSQGNWSSCCYTDDHKQAECMWNKPSELSAYTGSGFEIAAFLGEQATAKAAIDGWKSSAGHNEVMINAGTWKKMKWNAVGVGLEKGYAVIWFGTVEDADKTAPSLCK